MKTMPVRVLALSVVLHISNVSAADSCPLVVSDVVAKSSKVVTLKQVKQLPQRVSVRNAVTALGPAAVDAGSGLYVLVWHMEDGSMFSVSSAGDFCAPSVSTNVVPPPKAPNNSLKSDAAKPRTLG